jgi:tetratricopeptide (TPR) repeat protein
MEYVDQTIPKITFIWLEADYFLFYVNSKNFLRINFSGGKCMLRKLTVLASLFIILSTVVSAQIPDKFTNLQVLPKLISKEKLLETMRSFTGALGVNCDFCHAEQEGTDKKPEKEEARIMLKMVQGINKDYLPQLSEYTKDIMQVTCITCHRGNKQPLMLEDVLMSTIKEKGLPEAISTYHQLHDKYYGTFTYDFSDHTLVKLIEMLNDEKMSDDAVGIANLNLEMYPKSGVAYYGLGEAYQAKGDNEKALENYQKAKELMPEGARFIDRKIQELQKKE